MILKSDLLAMASYSSTKLKFLEGKKSFSLNFISH